MIIAPQREHRFIDLWSKGGGGSSDANGVNKTPNGNPLEFDTSFRFGI